MMRANTVDPIVVSVIQHRLLAIVAEMGEAMLRTAYSQLLNSSRDFSTAICDLDGRLIAQAAGRLGSFADHRRHVVAGLGQVSGDRFPPDGMVVYHHHAHRDVRRDIPAIVVHRRPCGARGIQNSTSLPWPGLLSMVVVPPQSAIRPRIDWAMPRRPASAASAGRSGGNPMPSSRTVTRTPSRSSSRRIQARASAAARLGPRSWPCVRVRYGPR